ncbi:MULTISPECIES: hypothetical protein [unclassified Pseudomonas]|uniref:hypothetical protein n=1 Tax=unclassified Pseudomonas TaxID=196821 RepID=UPI00215E0F4C|nr:hypothetical protein [Pseudomonas sp. B21-015]UVM48093.1 hypothetical protein LOY38_16860 [Pseudomonas sp. B21-015]
MQQPIRKLTLANIDAITEVFYRDLAVIGQSIAGKTGLPLMLSMKRDRLGHGPYPGVSLFEAANRIMSDLVILHGVAALLKDKHFPFDEYTVEFGNENHNDFDIYASSTGVSLAGEAFNVAPSFFQNKKSSALNKLRSKAPDVTYRVVMFNAEAVRKGYAGRGKDGIYHVVVDITSGAVAVSPKPTWNVLV